MLLNQRIKWYNVQLFYDILGLIWYLTNMVCWLYFIRIHALGFIGILIITKNLESKFGKEKQKIAMYCFFFQLSISIAMLCLCALCCCLICVLFSFVCKECIIRKTNFEVCDNFRSWNSAVLGCSFTCKSTLRLTAWVTLQSTKHWCALASSVSIRTSQGWRCRLPCLWPHWLASHQTSRRNT